MTNARPTVLIGTSGQPHAFSEPIVRAMAANVSRPVIFPLSNPTERSEATPEDLLGWTQGRAIVGTGSPFPPTKRDGRPFRVDQTNNAYVYPGVGLGAITVKATRISDAMFLAAARTLADLSPAKHDPQANLLPPLAATRKLSFHVAIAVAQQAIAEDLAQPPPDGDLAAAIQAKMWEPAYATYRRRPAAGG
jgi:malate dehydrogenase (oxaloacetate-decarboxylating)